MSETTVKTIKIEPRSGSGKGDSKKIRKEGKIPILLTAKGESESFQINRKDMQKLFADGVTESTLLHLQPEGQEPIEVFIKDYQIDHLTDEILHVDFYRVTRGQLIQTKVPIRYDGAPVGIKSGGIQETFLEEVEVECFPRHLPSEIHIDISGLNIHDSIHARDLPVLEGVKYLIPTDSVMLAIGLAKTQTESTTEEESEQEAE